MPTKKIKAKRIKKIKYKKSNTNNKLTAISSLEVTGQLNVWAHAGTAESIKKLDEFIKHEENKELRAHAKLARGEAEYFYYDPRNDREEKQLMLIKMIHQEEERLFELLPKQDAAALELKQLALEARVHARLMNNKKYDKDKQEDWKYRFSQDYEAMVKERLVDIENDVAYKTAWVDEANKLITVKRYKNIPPEVCDSFHFDGEGETFWVDEPLDEEDFNKDWDNENDCCETKCLDGPGEIDPEEIPF